MRRKGKAPPPDVSQPQLERAFRFAGFWTTLVDRFGWPGVVVLFMMFAMQFWSTADQKRRFVELYFLGTGIGRVFPLVIAGVVFAATALAQHRIYSKKVELLKSELERVGNEKSELQQELANRKLQRGSALP